jgi:tetratricopeptide (TPR) repeat protein
MVDDGTPPSSAAVIERVCNGTAHSEGYTDASGYFFLTLGQSTEVIGDASEATSGTHGSAQPGALGSAASAAGSSAGRGGAMSATNRYSNCELRARLGGYLSQSINLTSRTSLDDPNVGTILIHRMGESERPTTVTATTLTAPKDARKALQKGMELAKKNKPEEAIASLKEAVKLYPEYAYAWCELGKLQADNGHTEEGHLSFEAASRAEPRWPEPYLRLSLMAVEAHNWKEVADTTDRALRLNSFEYPQAFFFNAVANYNLRHVEVAEKSALSAERLDVQHQFPQIAHLLGTILAQRHQYAEAAEKFRAYLAMAPNAEDAPAVRKQLDTLEKLVAASSQVARKDQN